MAVRYVGGRHQISSRPVVGHLQRLFISIVRGVIYVDVNPKYRTLAATAPPPPTHKRKDSQYA